MTTPPSSSTAASFTDNALAPEVGTLLDAAAQVLPENGLHGAWRRARGAGRPLRIKWGVDPTGSELHLGHAVLLHKLRQFQEAGHIVVLVVGDFTATIGDPSGRNNSRKLMTLEQTTANARTYLEQIGKILRADRLEVRRNSEWMGTMSTGELLAHAQQLTVAQLLERDDFAARYTQHRPIALSEFFYPLLQGIDSLAVDADVEIGGTDQLFNLMVGRELQRAAGKAPQVVFTMPLLVGLDGVAKMSKSLGNYVAFTDSATEQFGKLMSIPDALVKDYARLCAPGLAAEVGALTHAVELGGPGAGQAKRVLAKSVVAIYHSDEDARAAEAAFDERFRRRSVPSDAPRHVLPAGTSVHLPALAVEARLCTSRAEARRLIDAGAVRLDGDVLEVGSYDLTRSELVGRVLQLGRRRAVQLAD